MTFLSFPKYPGDKPRSMRVREDVPPVVRAPRPNLLLNFLILMTLLALLWWMRELANLIPQRQTIPPRPPLDFTLVVERFGEVRLFQPREVVLDLLGPPSQQTRPEPRFAQMVEMAEHSHRHHRIPDNRVWEKWIDPNDEDRWVAILFAGEQVYWQGHQGVEIHRR